MARGEWWEYLIPGHNVGLMVGDVYDGITGNSEKNAGTGVFGTRKNGSNSYQYAQSNDRVTTAKNNLDYIKGQKPGEYQSEYGSQISGTQSQLDKMNRDGFSYDYTKDAAYQQYKNQYTRQAKLANQNAQANAAAMTGGYGSSYGTQAGQNAYASTMNSLDNVLDSLYSQSKAQYNTEKSGLQQQLSGLQSAEKQDYSQYQNDLANWTEGLQYKKNEYDNAYSAKQNGWQNFMNGALQVAGIAAKILPLFFI